MFSLIGSLQPFSDCDFLKIKDPLRLTAVRNVTVAGLRFEFQSSHVIENRNTFLKKKRLMNK